MKKENIEETEENLDITQKNGSIEFGSYTWSVPPRIEDLPPGEPYNNAAILEDRQYSYVEYGSKGIYEQIENLSKEVKKEVGVSKEKEEAKPEKGGIKTGKKSTVGENTYFETSRPQFITTVKSYGSKGISTGNLPKYNDNDTDWYMMENGTIVTEREAIRRGENYHEKIDFLLTTDEKVFYLKNGFIPLRVSAIKPIEINKSEEVFLNYIELADSLTVNYLKEKYSDKYDEVETAKEYVELLEKYKLLILKHERNEG